MNGNESGFTLLEAVTVLAIAAVLATLGVPAFSKLLERHEARATMHLLTSSLAEARTAAITKGRPVSICPTQDGRNCRGDRNWDAGWLIFIDANRDEMLQASSIIRHVGRTTRRISIASSAGRHRIRYQPTGLSGGSNATLRLCSPDGTRHVASVVVNLAGRTRSHWAEADTPCPPLP